jgi:hypothetical protein
MVNHQPGYLAGISTALRFIILVSQLSQEAFFGTIKNIAANFIGETFHD